MNEPTNADIYKFMGRIDQRLDSMQGEIEGIHTQTKLTNGRVTKLERRNERIDDRVQWEKENEVNKNLPATTAVAVADGGGVKMGDFIKIILSLIGLATALVTALTLIAGKIG